MATSGYLLHTNVSYGRCQELLRGDSRFFFLLARSEFGDIHTLSRFVDPGYLCALHFFPLETVELKAGLISSQY